MRGRTALVTGASGGIGREIARDLARQGAQVIMVARDRSRGQAARDDVAHSTGNDQVDLLLADLSSQGEVRRLARDFLSTHTRLHVLVNNAGGMFAKRHLTDDGLELTFALNHLAYFLLAHELTPALTAAGGARVVNVSSEAQAGGHVDFADLQGESRYSGWRAYAQSKLANVLFTRELARRHEPSLLTANCLHPGFVQSGFAVNNGPLYKAGLALLRPFALTPVQGADTATYLASSPEVAGVSGQYFIKRKVAPGSRESRDAEVARRLWEASEQLTGTGR
jgi:NAD(P)-dependent dehydrogenase (short-subunit alcohol dehydrogenase family)